jgi:glutamate dehydrogenase
VARDVSLLSALIPALDVAQLAHDAGTEPGKVAALYFAVGENLGLNRLRALAANFSPPEHWDRLALRRLLDDLSGTQRAIAARLLASGNSAEQWAQSQNEALERNRTFLAALESSGELSVAKLMLAFSQIQNLS